MLPRDKQIQIIKAIVEGVSIRSIERMTDVHRDTRQFRLPSFKSLGGIDQLATRQNS